MRYNRVLILMTTLILVVSGINLHAAGTKEQTAGDATADKWPEKPIQLIVAWAAGGGTDRVARAIAPILEKKLGVPVAIINRPGGTGVVGHTALAHAKPDGYTIGMITPQLVTGPILKLTELNFRDIAPLALINEDAGSVTVRADAPWNSLSDFINYAKANPEKIRIGNSGPGGTQHMTAVTLERETGIIVIHTPYDGANPAITDLLGGHIEAVTSSAVEVEPQVRSGLLKMLAILSRSRNESFPDVKTGVEQGYDLQLGTWRGLAAPKNLPPDIFEKLSKAVHDAAADYSFTSYMEKEGFGAQNIGPKEFMAFLEQQEKIYTEFYREKK